MNGKDRGIYGGDVGVFERDITLPTRTKHASEGGRFLNFNSYNFNGKNFKKQIMLSQLERKRHVHAHYGRMVEKRAANKPKF